MKGLNLDIIGAVAGAAGAGTQGKREGVPMSELIIRIISGAILGWGSLGLIEEYATTDNFKIMILVAFVVGTVSDEILKYLGKFIKSIYNFGVSWLGNKTKKDETN